MQTAKRLWNQIRNQGSILRIRHAGQVTPWLIQQDINIFMALKLWIDELAFDLDVVALRISFGAQFGDDLPIHANLTVDHQLFSVTPGSNAGSGDEFL